MVKKSLFDYVNSGNSCQYLNPDVAMLISPRGPPMVHPSIRIKWRAFITSCGDDLNPKVDSGCISSRVGL